MIAGDDEHGRDVSKTVPVTGIILDSAPTRATAMASKAGAIALELYAGAVRLTDEIYPPLQTGLPAAG
ncbi:hypothetical protein [Bradyrhizobium lablabi]|uniref:hypothetical protein n=1 Tax=Bradyrhizobium lablabi TaxID=722472 RepID=UPI001BAB2EE0|nr:hypothetical protein [Bradyrhizobium lablabi]MBR0697799.1 hypothetical protein [Bradyrhizobium lablabi]